MNGCKAVPTPTTQEVEQNCSVTVMESGVLRDVPFKAIIDCIFADVLINPQTQFGKALRGC